MFYRLPFKHYLSGGSGLAAGQYTLLPAHYALLPGAFLITPKTGSAAVIPGTSSTNTDGAPIVTGYRTIAGTGIKDQTWSEFIVESGSVALTRSELTLSYASSFFSKQAINNDQAKPRLPQDGGQLKLEGTTQLDLPSVLSGGSLGGLGGTVDIISANLSVVSQKTGLAGVELLASDINKLKIGSLLLGGSRKVDLVTGNTVLEVKANSVTIAEDAKLVVPEILLAATDKVELKKNAGIAAQGGIAETANQTVLQTVGDGALLRVSTGQQALIKRTDTQGLTGDLIINNGAVIAAGAGSILIDSTDDARLEGLFDLSGSLAIGAEAINLGEVPVNTSGLTLDKALLSKLAVDELMLTSRSAINLYGDLGQLAFGNLVLNSAGLVGYNNAGKTTQINAETVTLANYSGVKGSTGTGTGTGTLNIHAGSLILDKSRILDTIVGNKFSGFAIAGFEQINFNLDQAVIGRGESQLNLSGNTHFNTGVVTGESVAKMIIDASGYDLTLASTGQVSDAIAKGIGAQLALTADTVTVDTQLLFNGGSVKAESLTGNTKLGSQALLDVSGALVKAGLSPSAVINSGKITLGSKTQSVIAEAGSQLLLNANAALMQAGTLMVSAANGQAQLNGLIDAHGFGNEPGGTLALDVNSLTTSGFNGLNSLAANSGFSGGFDLRLRSGDLNINAGQTLTAHTINIAIDNGTLSVDGTLDARGDDGGLITLSTVHELTLNEHANLLANAQAVRGDGGKVYLSSVNGTGVNAGIKIINGAHINVSKAGVNQVNYAGDPLGFIANVDDGEVHLRADRLDTNADGIADVNVIGNPIDAVVGAAKTVVEAVKIYDENTGSTGINADISTKDQSFNIGEIKTETLAYMNALSAHSYEVLPGIEIRSDGDITLASPWNFATWSDSAGKKFPGFLTLRASGNLNVNNDLTDGFATGKLPVLATSGLLKGRLSDQTVTDMLQAGSSWSYKLMAGADLGAAYNSAVDSGKGNLTLAAATKIRTGTGDIEIHAGQDVIYSDDTSVIYTAGRPDAINRYGFKPGFAGTYFYAEYPIDGGNVSLTAGRDIKGYQTTQLITDWLVRTGDWSASNTHDGERPTAWGVMVSNRSASKKADYRESLGALGGGDISIKAGRNISDISVVIPTTGKQVGQYKVAIDPNDKLTNIDMNYLTNVVEVNGGGNLNVVAGGDVTGGLFYVDGGAASIAVAGSLAEGNNALNPILALGDTQFSVTAGNNIALAAVIDPMALPQGKVLDKTSLFFRYSPDSAVALTSLAGDINLKNPKDIASHTNLTFVNTGALNIYPATLKASALAGDLNILGDLTLYPSASGQLELFALDTISSSDNLGRVILPDSDPEKLPSWFYPASNFNNADVILNQTQGINTAFTDLHMATPVHQGDEKPVLISTGNGDIGSDSNLLKFILAKPALVQSGKDIIDVVFDIQHNTNDSITLIAADRDFIYTTNRFSETGILKGEEKGAVIAGLGQLTVVSGRNVDLGASLGITSNGNSKNPALSSDGGANISVIAGLVDGKIDVAGFADKYMTGADNKYAVENQLYVNQLTKYMRDLTGQQSLSTADSMATFSNLSNADQSRFEKQLFSLVQGVYFQELSAAATELANAKINDDQDVAKLTIYKLIETLFPGTTLLSPNASGKTLFASNQEGENLLASYQDYFSNVAKAGYVDDKSNTSTIVAQVKAISEQVKAGNLNLAKNGDISLFFSKLHTERGGDINLLTPNGGVNAGLAVSSGIAADKLGVIVKSKGNINAIVRDDFAVNKARVMTLDGGSIAMGSTQGDLNAGLGAQAAISAPPPQITFKDGLTVITPRAALSGSGIRTSSFPGQPQGDVLLYALNGVIDAGEAGIDGNNLTLSANAIVGANNITFGSTGVGVPVAATGSIAAGLTGTSNVTANATQTAQAGTGFDESSKAVANAVLGILSVDFLGFGD